MREEIEKQIYDLGDKIDDHPCRINEVLASAVDLVDKENSINKVREFMTTFKQVMNSKPAFPDEETMKLRLNIELEELIELAEAMGPNMYGYMQRLLFNRSQEVHYDMEKKRETLKPDLVKVLDSFCDKRYVNDGTILAFGMQNIFEEAFHDVHLSNMSKACDCQEDLEATLEKYKSEGIEVTFESSNGLSIVMRKSDKKVLKNINYKAVELEKYIPKEF